MDYTKYIRVVEDFPKPGISFKDISPLLADGQAFNSAIKDMAEIARTFKPTLIVGPEARGFIFGTPLSYELGCGFIMARKSGKLPGNPLKISYDLEYGQDTMFIPENIVTKDDRVLIVDDLLATGGTLVALSKLLRSTGATVCGALTFIQLQDLNGEKILNEEGVPFKTVLKL